ncbi:MAG: hypothetical protein ACYS9X_29520 [Planctomycetota bacterium]|jgi:hypothetical protein
MSDTQTQPPRGHPLGEFTKALADYVVLIPPHRVAVVAGLSVSDLVGLSLVGLRCQGAPEKYGACEGDEYPGQTHFLIVHSLALVAEVTLAIVVGSTGAPSAVPSCASLDPIFREALEDFGADRPVDVRALEAAWDEEVAFLRGRRAALGQTLN